MLVAIPAEIWFGAVLETADILAALGMEFALNLAWVNDDARDSVRAVGAYAGASKAELVPSLSTNCQSPSTRYLYFHRTRFLLCKPRFCTPGGSPIRTLVSGYTRRCKDMPRG